MTVKPIAAGIPQRIIEKINELVNAVNTGGGSGGGGVSLLRCTLTYTGAGTAADPYVGHLDHASEILDALDRKTSYDPIIVIAWDFNGQQGQCLPTMADHRIETIQGAQSETSYLNTYGIATRSTAFIGLIFMLAIDYSGADPVYIVADSLSQTNTQNATIENDVISFTNPR